MKQRICYLDNMKGVAIILVVIGHIMQFSFGFETSQPVKFLCFHMPLFFYISGFLAYKKVACQVMPYGFATHFNHSSTSINLNARKPILEDQT